MNSPPYLRWRSGGIAVPELSGYGTRKKRRWCPMDRKYPQLRTESITPPHDFSKKLDSPRCSGTPVPIQTPGVTQTWTADQELSKVCEPSDRLAESNHFEQGD